MVVLSGEVQMKLVEVTSERMLHTSNPSVQSERFGYDALGRRVAKRTEAAQPLLQTVGKAARAANHPTT